MIRITPRLLALIPLAVGINLALGKFAAVTSIPVFLDTVGTILVAALLGLWPALLTGLVSQLAFTVTEGNAMWLAFLPVQLAVAACASFAARRAWFRSTPIVISAGLTMGVISASMSWPIAYLMFGGVTAGGVTLVTTLLTGAGVPLKWAVFAASLTSDLMDKSATFLIVRIVLVSLPARAVARFPGAGRALGRA